MPHLFISYARSDGRHYAAKLEADLQSAGYTTWRDLRDIDEYQDFSAEIEIAIREADYVIACISPSVEMNQNSFVRREIIYADANNKPIIPCIFPNTVPIVLINHLTWISFYQGTRPAQTLDYESGFATLIERLRKTQKPQTSRSIDDPYVEYLRVLYEQIVDYLQQTVFALNITLVELHSEDSPNAVVPRQALPLAFFGLSGGKALSQKHQQFTSFHEAFEKYSGRVLLLGDPGAGKTTTLLAFVRDAVWKRLEDPSLPLPITAPIATWDPQLQPLFADWLSTQIPLLNRDDLIRLISEGRTLLAMDGLDELGSIRYQKVESVDKDGEKRTTSEPYDPRDRFLKLLPHSNKIVLSCRARDFAEIGQQAPLTGAVKLTLLDDNQMKEYLREQPDLWLSLQSDSDLLDVARTPLLLSLFAYAFHKATPTQLQQLRDLNRSPGELRDIIFDTYVRRRYEHEAVKRRLEYSLDEMLVVLCRVALADIASLGSENLIPAERFAPLPDTDPSHLIAQARLLHLLAPSQNDNEYRFIHLLLRDFFAYKGGVEALRSPESFERFITSQALGHVRGQLRDIRVVELLIKTLDDPAVEVRAAAVHALGEIGDAHAVEALAIAAHDNEWMVQFLAIQALGHIYATPSTEVLVRLLDDSNEIVRNRAKWELHLYSKYRVENLVAELYGTDEEQSKRAERLLRYFSDLDAQEVLKKWRESK